MVIRGSFFELNGEVGSADAYLRSYNEPVVDRWIRCEYLEKDLPWAFEGILAIPTAATRRRENTAPIPYIRDVSFYFTKPEIAALYGANPLWAKTEELIYGDLL
jgi:hypothetical protein